jgi:hypothetical protein
MKLEALQTVVSAWVSVSFQELHLMTKVEQKGHFQAPATSGAMHT